MKPRFPTSLVTFALTLTLALTTAGCSGMPFGTPSVTPSGTLSGTAHTQPPSAPNDENTGGTGDNGDATGPVEAGESSERKEANFVIEWRYGRAHVRDNATGDFEALGGGVTVTTPAADGLSIAVPKRDGMEQAHMPGDLSQLYLADGVLALAATQPFSRETYTWMFLVEETTNFWILTADGSISGTTEAPREVSVTLADSAVESAKWVNEPEGPRLFLEPGEWARTGSLAVQEYGWGTVLRDVPEVADYPGKSLENQFKCHALGALDKDTWNLETWYEDLGLLGFMAERCNPV